MIFSCDLQKAINEIIEQRLIRINQKGKIRYFSWDEVFLSQKDVRGLIKKFREVSK